MLTTQNQQFTHFYKQFTNNFFASLLIFTNNLQTIFLRVYSFLQTFFCELLVFTNIFL